MRLFRRRACVPDRLAGSWVCPHCEAVGEQFVCGVGTGDDRDPNLLAMVARHLMRAHGLLEVDHDVDPHALKALWDAIPRPSELHRIAASR